MEKNQVYKIGIQEISAVILTVQNTWDELRNFVSGNGNTISFINKSVANLNWAGLKDDSSLISWVDSLRPISNENEMETIKKIWQIRELLFLIKAWVVLNAQADVFFEKVGYFSHKGT
ncbi:MAG: hypothetical protein V1698_01330 [bacterium]